MGNKVMGKFRKARHQGFQEDQIDYLQDKWQIISIDGVVDTKKFADSYNITESEATKFINFMDVDETGKVDQYKFKVGSAILCQSQPEQTAKLFFKLYDIDGDGVINDQDLNVFTRSLMFGLAYYNEKPNPSPKQVSDKTQSLMTKWNFQSKNKKMTESEFILMLKKDPEVLRLFYEYGFITKAELSLEENDYNDIDSNSEVEMERRQKESRVVCVTDSGQYGLEEDEVATTWKNKVKGQAPSEFKQTPDQQNPPNAYLDLEYVYGYRCHDTRNNLRYGNKGQVVYHTAGVGVVMNSINMTQQHYLQHSDDITCLDVYDNMVLTGQQGLTPLLMIWDVNTLKLISVWKDKLTNGISNCSFSLNGKLVVAVAMDDDHSIAIYDIQKGIAFRMDPKNTDNGLIAAGKMTPREVFDIKFIPGDYSILVACMKEINIVTWRDGKIMTEKVIWCDQIPQAALTIGFINDQFVTGMFSGQLLVWSDNQLERSVKAHAEPVQAMWTRSQGRGIITATKRGVIMIWDQTLICEREFDSRQIGLGPNLFYPPGPAITSVCESQTGQILFGTRRSEIVEVQPFTKGQKIVAKLLMQGHYKGELWGLVVHPKSQNFYTVGEDEMLAQWDATNKRIIRSIGCQYASKTLDISSNGKLLAVGATNGRVFIFDPNTLTKISEISEYLDPDKEIVSIVKFSPNSEVLAVTYCRPFNNIVFYSAKTNALRKINEIKNIPAAVSCLDFSSDSKYIQVNLQNNDIMYYSVTNGTELKNVQSILKDEQWFTWTCILGWQVQGIWPKCSSGSDINSCDRSNDGTVLVTGDDFGKVKLFQYPCPIELSGSAKFTGHSSYVQNVRFTYKDQYVISVGGDELSIFQWKFINHEQEKLIIDHTAIDAETIIDNEPLFGKAAVEQGDQALAVKPFLGEMKASTPSWYKPNAKRDNVLPKGNLSIHHVMGFRYFYILDECRDMCAWTDKENTIAFATATLGVVMDIKSLDQTFYNVHEEDIVSFAMHPSRKFIASGQMAQAGKAKCIDIYVWDIETKKQVAHFNEFHLQAIVFLQFSPNGTLLLSVGQDNDNSLAIHDWQTNRMIATSNIDKAKVNCVAWASEEEFVTVGNKHVKFWKLNGRNVLGKMGAMGGKFESQFSVTYAFNNTICVTGSGKGNLYAWKDGSTDKSVAAHKGKIQSLKMDDTNKILYSAGMDGKVCSWGFEGGNLVKLQEIVQLTSQFNSGITSMDINNKNGQFLLGTSCAQIFTFDPVSKKQTLVQQGHYGEELWGACVSPNSYKFVSAGADCTVRIWDILTKRMIIASQPFTNDIRAIDWSVDGKFIVCGDMLGFIYLLDPHTLEVKDKGITAFTKMPKRQSTYWIEDIKISPDGKYCAFGAHGGASPVEMWEINYPKFGKQKVINAGLTSALLHIDWSVDGTIALVNSEAYEMKFIDMQAGKNARSSACNDVEFATWTCKLGFPVQGIFPNADYSDVNTVCRSQSKKYLVTGEDTQKVVLMQYPVVVEKQKRKEYIGHSSHVTRVRFTFDDNFLVSTGGNDKSIIIWKTDFGSQEIADNKGFQVEGEDDVAVIVPKKKVENVEVEEVELNETDDIFQKGHIDKGDQFMAVKPWMGAIKEPTPPYYDDKKFGFKPPKCEISIEYVYGYRSKDMRSNIYFLANDKILYNAAALAIILDPESNTQRFFDRHEDDITAIDMNPVDRMTVATGELGAKPSIYVWDAGTLQVKCQFKSPLTKGIVSLAFSPDGKRLVACAIDVNHFIAVFDVTGPGSVIWTDKGGPDTIIDLRWNNNDSYTSIGVKHFQVWTLTGNVCKKTKGVFGQAFNKLSGVAVNGGDTICGASNGEVQVWKGNEFSKQIGSMVDLNLVKVEQKEGKASKKPQENYHTQSCDCIHVSANYVMSGGKDGLIIIFDKTYQIITLVDCKKLFPDSVLASIRAIYFHTNKQQIVVGTLGSEIYLISFDTPEITATTQFKQEKILMKGHFCPNVQWTNEVWGLSVNKENNNLFVTCSDDGTFRIWDAYQRKQVDIGFTTFDKDLKFEKREISTGDYQDMCKARSIAVAPNGSGFVLGMKDGTMRVFDEKCVQTKVFKRAKEWVSDIKFSPDGTSMVYGSHDNALYAVNWPDLKPIGKGPMNKHSSYITHFDYSCDGFNLHSTCGAYELLFWDVNGAKQLPGGASALKDEKWHTWTVTLGWPVQGIWPECADGTDINSVDRSNATIDGKSDPKTSYYLLATGDDFSKVRILRYPSLKKSSEAVVGRGHSSHVTNVRFNYDDTKIFSTGGEDQCVIQWQVTKK